MARSPPSAQEGDQTEEYSDYGSDFSPEEEEIIDSLLANFLSVSNHTDTIGDVEDNPIIAGVEVNDSPKTLRVHRDAGRGVEDFAGRAVTEGASIYISRGDEGLGVRAEPIADIARESVEPEGESQIQQAPVNGNDSNASPIARFRSKTRSKKPSLSVTDLVSPAWCELQYFYTLAAYGKKRATFEMKKGSKIHQKLEEEVYTTVKVDVQTKEDVMGLQIWNTIQGLKMLVESGYTRELKIWGSINGVLVAGIIDELSVSSSSPSMATDDVQLKDEETRTLDQYFPTLETTMKSTKTRNPQKLFLCDVKTRSARSMPNAISFRPTKIQLMLYHRLLGDLVSGDFDFSLIAERQGLDKEAPFSDSFIAQISNLNEDTFELEEETASSPGSLPASSQDSMSVLLKHNSLSKLWELMIRVLRQVLPEGRNSLGGTLKAEYRSPVDGEIMGEKSFPMDYEVLETYLSYAMKWWQGERAAEGVPVEEAFKCRMCEFAERCDWRLEKEAEAIRRARARRQMT